MGGVVVVDALGRHQHQPQKHAVPELGFHHVHRLGLQQDGRGVHDLGLDVLAAVDVDGEGRPEHRVPPLHLEVEDGGDGLHGLGLVAGEDQCRRVVVTGPQHSVVDGDKLVGAGELEGEGGDGLVAVADGGGVDQIDGPDDEDLVVLAVEGVVDEGVVKGVEDNGALVADIGDQAATGLLVDDQLVLALYTGLNVDVLAIRDKHRHDVAPDGQLSAQTGVKLREQLAPLRDLQLLLLAPDPVDEQTDGRLLLSECGVCVCVVSLSAILSVIYAKSYQVGLVAIRSAIVA